VPPENGEASRFHSLHLKVLLFNFSRFFFNRLFLQADVASGQLADVVGRGLGFRELEH
jgi:hypothetical protein